MTRAVLLLVLAIALLATASGLHGDPVAHLYDADNDQTYEVVVSARYPPTPVAVDWTRPSTRVERSPVTLCTAYRGLTITTMRCAVPGIPYGAPHPRLVAVHYQP